MQDQLTTDRRQAYIRAIENGHTTVRELARAVGVSSTSVVSHHLQRLATDGYIILHDKGRGLSVADGREYCQGWDMAARLAGNDEA